MTEEKEKIKVSIIIPVYNMAEYLHQCITSVIAQTIAEIEVILVDDGSTDESGVICDFYKNLDDRIQVVHQDNRGVVSARECGVKFARGKYIGFVDSDDYVDNQMFERLYSCIEETDADFVYSGYESNNKYYVGSAKKVLNINRSNREKLIREVIGREYIELEGLSVNLWTKLYKRSFIIDFISDVPKDVVLGEDYMYVLLSIIRANRVASLNETYYHYTVRNNSLSHCSEIKKSVRNVLYLWDIMEKLLIKEGWYPEMINDIENGLCKDLLEVLRNRVGREYIQKYYFRDISRVINKKVVIYGAGAVGVDYYSQIARCKNCNIVAWVDQNPYMYGYDFANIIEPREILYIKFDVIVIAQMKCSAAKEIIAGLQKMGVEKKNIIWSKPGFVGDVEI